MLIVAPQCHEHFDQVLAFADSKGIREALEKKLVHLHLYGTTWKDPEVTRCLLIKDFAPNSFNFIMSKRRSPNDSYVEWFGGGLTFHPGAGANDQTLAISLARGDADLPRWEIHT
jgi:hypothetical protein